MIHDIASATYKGEYKIEVTFDNGKKGVVDFSKYLERGGIFRRFKDIDFFKNFAINKELGVLTWQGEIDVAPETLYAEATGTSLPHWMEKRGKPSSNKASQRAANSRR
ncbi:MAG TPA: DUF2442 domain-containing protein [Thermodesulfobacteriota bacterium]|jgi:hypothetical protein|nr:DUF2442 domain-containing protein [Thermodesulfobacteriota bacterium]